MTVLILTFVGLAAVIIIASHFLAGYADRLAEQTGLGGSLTGLILLAGATSLPEFSIGFNAVRMQAADLTAGDVLGSSLMNLLILGILDLASRTPGRVFSRTASAHALSAIVAITLTGIILVGILVDTPWSIARLGPFSWAVIISYLLMSRMLYLDQKISAEADIASTPLPQEQDAGRGSLRNNVLKFVGAAAVIFLVAPPLAHTADALATQTGLGKTFFGTVFVAFMTSLPEAVSTFAALRLGTIDMAIGNILGSNAFNMIILAVTDSVTPIPVLSQVSDTHAITAGCVIVTTCVAAASLLYRAEKRWWIIEPDAALIVLMVLVSLFLVYVNRAPDKPAEVSELPPASWQWRLPGHAVAKDLGEHDRHRTDQYAMVKTCSGSCRFSAVGRSVGDQFRRGRAAT